MHAVILAGGKGTRLASRLGGLPKPLIDVDGTPLLGRQLALLAREGVTEVLLLVNHAADRIADYVGANDFGMTVRLADDGAPRGTAGATLAVLDRLPPTFLVVYGDTLFDIDIGAMLTAHRVAGVDGTLFLHPNDHPADSDLVAMQGDGRITEFFPYSRTRDRDLRNLVNAAFYVLEKAALEPYRAHALPCDFGRDLFPEMIAGGARLQGYASYEYIKDIGTPARLDEAVGHLRTGLIGRASRHVSQKAVFLDRDGTLNRIEHGAYITRPEHLELFEDTADAVRELNAAEFRCVLTTNQPVIARGDCTIETLDQIHAKLETVLGHSGAYLDAIQVCPHHPDQGFPGEITALKIDCACRKPKTGLIDEAVAALNIDRSRSWLIGDSSGDILAANRAGLSAMLLERGEAGRDGKSPGVADAVAPNLRAAVDLIVHRFPLIDRAIADFAAPVSPGVLILIAGPARSGKSLVATALRQSLRGRGLNAQVVALDRWIKPPVDRTPGVVGRYDLASVKATFAEWLEGSETRVVLPFYDRYARRNTAGDALVLSADAVLIIEGVPAFLLDTDGDRRIYRIYINAEEAARGERVIADLFARGHTIDEAHAIQASRLTDEATIVRASASKADFTLSLDGILKGDPQ
jgi:histidinol-phosphate phosphatase family protein